MKVQVHQPEFLCLPKSSKFGSINLRSKELGGSKSLELKPINLSFKHSIDLSSEDLLTNLRVSRNFDEPINLRYTELKGS